MTPLHAAVAKIAKNKPGLVMSLGAVRGILLNNFKRAVAGFRAHSVPVEGLNGIEARLVGLSVDPETFKVSLIETAVGADALVGPGFDVQIALHVAGDLANQFSTISLTLKDLKFSLKALAPMLMLGSPDYDIAGSVATAPTRAAALAASGLTEEEVARVEGALAYFMSRRVANSTLATVSSIDIGAHFTAFDLLGNWSLRVVQDGLLVIPDDGIVIKEKTGCPTKDSVPDLVVKPGQKSDVGNETYKWPINVGGLPPATVRPAGSQPGFVSLYAPKPLWEQRFNKAMPGLVYAESDNGFIGYDLTASAGFKYVGLKVDEPRFGLIVDFEFVANGFAFLTVDVPCVGRSDLAYARFATAPSKVSILLSVVLTETGKLQLEAQVDQLTIGDVTATVSGFSRWLALAGGKAAVVGFVIDYVLKRVIEHNIPIKMREAIKQQVNSQNFQLLDLEDLAMFTRFGKFNLATFSGEPNSLLLGLASEG